MPATVINQSYSIYSKMTLIRSSEHQTFYSTVIIVFRICIMYWHVCQLYSDTIDINHSTRHRNFDMFLSYKLREFSSAYGKVIFPSVTQLNNYSKTERLVVPLEDVCTVKL
jgi:hypothetical protein